MEVAMAVGSPAGTVGNDGGMVAPAARLRRGAVIPAPAAERRVCRWSGATSTRLTGRRVTVRESGVNDPGRRRVGRAAATAGRTRHRRQGRADMTRLILLLSVL